MSLFKRSNKNKTASAASTPAQTPRTSIQTIRDTTGTKMTPEEALYKISHNMMSNASTASRDWHDLFKPQIVRYVRFADLKKQQTWNILDRAAGIRSLTIDISDAGWFLNNPYSPCVNLRTLRCVDFGYLEPGDYNDYYDYNLDEVGDRNLTGRPVDSNTNALNLVQSNLNLTALEVTHERQHYRANHFTPAVFLSISNLQSLLLIKIELDVVLPGSFLFTVLQYLPQPLEDLLFSVKGLHKLTGTSTAAQPTSQQHHFLRRVTLHPCCYWDGNEDDQTSEGIPFNEAIISLVRCSPRLVDLKVSNYCGHVAVLLQALADHCADVETIDFEGHSHPVFNAVTLTGSLLRLREFRLAGYYTANNEDERQLVPTFLRRSSSTLEVISIEPSYNLSNFATNPFMTAEWNFWPECPRLREYAFILKTSYFHQVAPDFHSIDVLVELLSRPTIACMELQKLRIGITDCSGYEECGFINDDTGSGSGSRSEREATSLPPKEPEFTRQDLRWLGFHRRWRSGEDKQLNVEADAHVKKLRSVKEDTQDENAGTAWARSYRRVGCNWKDWESLAGLYGCVPTRHGRARDVYVVDCDHVHCPNDMPYGMDDGLDSNQFQAYSSNPQSSLTTTQETLKPTMSLFKRSNKNKTASAASTPAQTPRTSIQTIRDTTGTKMTPEEALYKISHNMMSNASTESTTSSPAQTPVQTPCQTPRTSIQTLRDSGIQSNPDPDKIIRKTTRTAMTSAAIPMSVR
ncbi:hypothetical protein KI688_012778 [Linnemannia hyalina]|uniref:Uncharacterized protein n=1 Tax=Linnemannia hyalina TaxID=64524 RepID=A0A9P8BTA7_9FUNG|nr:hypothetical protein KI688_012778 [Linnemannia hyalina]